MGTKERDQDKVYLLILDIGCMVLSFFLATWIRYGFQIESWFWEVYGFAFVFVIVSYICIYFLFDSCDGIFKRGFFDEFVNVFQSNIILALFITGILFLYQKGAIYSRAFFACFFFCNVSINYVVRQYFKIILLSYYKKSDSSSKVMIVTNADQANEIIRHMRIERMWNYQITGLAVLDRSMVGACILGVEVVADSESLYDVITKEAVDEIFISVTYDNPLQLEEMILEFENMGVTVNLSIAAFQLNVKEKTIKSFGGYHVLTFSTKAFDIRSMALKRGMDIIGGLVGMLITALLAVLVAPAIWIESHGALVFSQIRVGKNGRRFKIYKFRSMYEDAEQRKKELMNQNEMEGLMFKVANDPRITKIGKFIRKTSIDEFPQFLNVLKGEMSLVGTRPPTEDEFLQYEGRHKRRLALKPGITGLWQVNGRNEINDFEDVVRLDLEYIDHWSMWLDLKILVKTIVVVLFRIGAK